MSGRMNWDKVNIKNKSGTKRVFAKRRGTFLISKYTSKCSICAKKINVGDDIVYDGKPSHPICWESI